MIEIFEPIVLTLIGLILGFGIAKVEQFLRRK